MPNTIKLHRVLRASPGKVYRAFLDADAMAKWLPPHGFTCKVHHLEADHVMQVVMNSVKLDIKTLKRAYKGETKAKLTSKSR